MSAKAAPFIPSPRMGGMEPIRTSSAGGFNQTCDLRRPKTGVKAPGERARLLAALIMPRSRTGWGSHHRACHKRPA